MFFLTKFKYRQYTAWHRDELFFSALGPQVYYITVLKSEGRLAGCCFVLFPTLFDWFDYTLSFSLNVFFLVSWDEIYLKNI